ncbi:MAG: lipocalin family protein [Rhodanobacter sp.]|jgi:apolipoprotein D and lipocalin family protein
MRMFRPLLLVATVIAAWPAVAASLPNRPVPSLDLHRYAGRWHEIARLPMYFERKCLDAVVATYTPNPDGTIHVHNTCRTGKGPMSADGVARFKERQPAALEVRFAPGWLAWLPMAWADYWVIEVDPGYQWAVIGNPDRDHLWILSRQPTMDRALLQTLIEHSRQRGYPVDRLIMPAPAGPPDRAAANAPPRLGDDGVKPAGAQTPG